MKKSVLFSLLAILLCSLLVAGCSDEPTAEQKQKDMDKVFTVIGEQLTRFPIDFEKIAQIILVVIVLYLLSAVFNFGQQFIMTRVSQRTVYELRKDLDEKMSRLPISYFDTHSNGDIMSRAINDMDNIASTLQQNLTFHYHKI